MLEVGIAIPVVEPSANLLVQPAARQGRVAEVEGVVVDGRDEARQGCDAMVASVENARGAELSFGDACIGVYAEGAAQRAENALTRVVRTAGVGAERESGDEIDESMNCPLFTRETWDRAEERSG